MIGEGAGLPCPYHTTGHAGADMVRSPGLDVVHVTSAFTYMLWCSWLTTRHVLSSHDTSPSSMVTAPALAGAHNPAARRDDDQLCAIMA